MPKIFPKKRRAKNQKFTIWWRFGGVAMVLLGATMAVAPPPNASATSCPDVKLIFVRGSGEERVEDQNFQTFKRAMTDKLALAHLSYTFEDLDYPAISVANPLTLLTTFVSGGEAYSFGASVLSGVAGLARETTDASCPNTRYVLAGYSQGAMVVSKALPKLDADKIIYAATFGDPKLYLPEGLGAVPPACSGQNLSNYRVYVPDCRAYSGMLGGYVPYQTADYIDKLGTWCNKGDFFCSSHLNMRDHTSYVADDIYEEASKTIFDKILKAFGIKNTYISSHDTAFLIDSTGSMRFLIDQYKNEALNLAEKTLANGGRVALYDYRDISDNYEPREWCNFETCTLETFRAGLDGIELDGGGDNLESLLSASFKAMKRLNWQYGATKSVVVLTDANYHNPDLDGITFADVVALSKSIDPVNFYIITPSGQVGNYRSLAEATDGDVFMSSRNLSVLTQTILERYDSLPRVEEETGPETLPTVSRVDFENISADRVKISWQNTGTRTLVILNDLILGVTEGNEIILDELDFSVENVVRLVPLGEERRGEGVEITLTNSVVVPKAPDTGKSS